MKLYEIDNAIIDLIDEETGEILDIEAFEKLQMEKDAKIENLCLWYKDLVAEADAIKNEKDILAERERRALNKAKNIKGFLNHLLDGQAFKTAKAEVKYRTSTATMVDDDFIGWAKENAPQLLTMKEPTVNKTEIKKAIQDGQDIKFARLETNKSISIK